MKRELKFRVYDKEIRRMSKSFTLGAFLIQWSDGDMDMPMQFADGDKRFEFMQFTGLIDKNGKDIYEGDIIKYTQHYFNMTNTEVKIKSVEWKFDKWGIYETNAGESDIEVIGNIYENKELLNT